MISPSGGWIGIPTLIFLRRGIIGGSVSVASSSLVSGAPLLTGGVGLGIGLWPGAFCTSFWGPLFSVGEVTYVCIWYSEYFMKTQ